MKRRIRNLINPKIDAIFKQVGEKLKEYKKRRARGEELSKKGIEYHREIENFLRGAE